MYGWQGRQSYVLQQAVLKTMPGKLQSVTKKQEFPRNGMKLREFMQELP